MQPAPDSPPRDPAGDAPALWTGPNALIVLDVDGTLTPFGGGDHRSLYERYMGRVIGRQDASNDAAAHTAAADFCAAHVPAEAVAWLRALFAGLAAAGATVILATYSREALVRAYLAQLLGPEGAAAALDWTHSVLDAVDKPSEVRRVIEGWPRARVLFVDDDGADVARVGAYGVQTLRVLKGGWLGGDATADARAAILAFAAFHGTGAA